VFYKDPQRIYRARAFDRFTWLEHGFGTREADVPSIFPSLATLKQVHSAGCVPALGRTGLIGEGDALLENTPGAVVAVKTADCVPILLVDGRRRAVAAVHAGWRGTAASIAARAVEAMGERFGSTPEDIEAAIGPAIGKCCYEVGPEVAERFGERGRAHIDLAEHNRRQLQTAGLPETRIYTANLCTRCLAADFHSFRRDGERAGRLYSFVGLR
jgi:YfiH family protein